MCLPQNVSSLVVYYNRDLFRRFEVAEPKAGWSWTEFIIRAVNLTRDAQGRPVAAGDPELGAVRPAIFGLGVEPTVIRLAPLVWSNGGDLFDDADAPTRFALERPSAQVALQEFLKLRTDYGVVPSDQDVEAEDDESRFANGRLAMLLSSRRSTPTFRTIKDFDWDVAPLPVFKRPAGILHSDAYCMARAGKAKDATWRFIEFANSPEGQQIVARTGRTVPSLKSVARSDAFLDPAAKPQSSAGLPGRDPDDPARADDLDLAGDRGRGGGDSRERPLSRPGSDARRHGSSTATTRPLFARARQ